MQDHQRIGQRTGAIAAVNGDAEGLPGGQRQFVPVGITGRGKCGLTRIAVGGEDSVGRAAVGNVAALGA